VKEAEQLEATHTEQCGCLVAKLHGHLGSLGHRGLRDLLVKLALEQPRAVVVDVDRLHLDGEGARTVFTSARMRVRDWPAVPIVLVATDPWQRRRLARSAPVFGSTGSAIASVRPLPRRRRALTELPAVPSCSRLARRFVRETCGHWALGLETSDALCVASELVENAFRHTGTAMRLRLELRDGLLTVAVRDGSPRPAVLRQGSSGTPVGFGLRVVSELSRAWGCSPDLHGGKVVWAVLAAGADWFTRFPAWEPG